MIRILLADDHVLVRAGLSQLLDAQPDIDVVGVACDGQEALEMARKLGPDVVLMDLQMPIVDGITAIGELTATLPEISVIALTTFQEPQQVTAALAAGARG
ncbi:MAG: response regulator, partial [Ilumatobacteraceae bacterium]